jgi:hypothetical protein
MLITAGDYAPPTVNGWLAVLKVVMKAAKRQLALPTLATEGISSFDESEHETYTEEEPNALLPEEVPPFLQKLRALRLILDRWGVDINAAANGVWINVEQHIAIHGARAAEYYELVTQALSQAASGPEAQAILEGIGQALQDGTFLP